MKTVSIITIAWNSEQTIEDTIQSVLSQSYKNIEYIIIDGASTDGTMNIINRYKEQISTVISEPDKGIYDAMNKGVAAATGDFIGILNSDDYYNDTKVIADVAKRFEETQCDSLYADLVYVDRNDPDKVARYWKAGEYADGHFLKGWMPPHPTFFLQKSCYDKYGAYNTRLTSAADYELMLRYLHRYKISVEYLPRVITRMRLGGQSNITLKNRIHANKEDRLAWELNGLKPGSLTMIRKPLGKVRQFFKKS
jgi:glycosyltransferase involved in cell wall biosynthesis